jgi:hypothetical protein
MTDTLVICTVKNQQNAKHGVCIKTIKGVANGMMTDRKNRKAGEVGMTNIDKANATDWLNEIVTKPNKWRMFYSDSETKTCAEAVLTMLKEQEAVEPSFKQDEKGISTWCCGSCGAYMYHIYDGIDKAKEYAKYCRQCGKKVKWE